ncbi:hypothetical protein PC116_g34792 [Phytophthora cactorum]|nr:hypothetical protein PC116_g34792 [Phytophthora cactorum]
MTETAGGSAVGRLGGGIRGGSLGKLRDGGIERLIGISFIASEDFLASSATRSSSSRSKWSNACSDAFGIACEGSKSSPTTEGIPWGTWSAGGVIG